jgi:putative glutamine amidotransferase
VNSYHSGCIFKLGSDLDAFAWADDFVEGFKHHTLPIWGLVWHPERMERPIIPQDLKDLLYG